jgi:hypothetical protein
MKNPLKHMIDPEHVLTPIAIEHIYTIWMGRNQNIFGIRVACFRIKLED